MSELFISAPLWRWLGCDVRSISDRSLSDHARQWRRDQAKLLLSASAMLDVIYLHKLAVVNEDL
jgi:hypothetical protein